MEEVVVDEVADGLQHELDSLWRFALKLTQSEDDAADLVQRTCLRALEQRGNYRPEGKLRSWLFRIEHRIWLNELRSRQLRQHGHLPISQDTYLNSTEESDYGVREICIDQPEGHVLFNQIIDAVNALPEAQRLVMLLINVEGFTYREASEILETPIGTVMSRLSRARLTIGEWVSNSHSSTLSGVNTGKSE